MLVKKTGQFLARLLILFAGLVKINVERPKIDYSYYLGPDWEPTYEGESTLVNNHSSWFVISSHISFL